MVYLHQINVSDVIPWYFQLIFSCQHKTFLCTCMASINNDTLRFSHLLILGLRPANERRRHKVTPVSHWLGANLESVLNVLDRLDRLNISLDLLTVFRWVYLMVIPISIIENGESSLVVPGLMATTTVVAGSGDKIVRDTLQWRYNESNGVWNHQPQDCLFNRSFRCRSKKTSKLRVTGLCAGNSSSIVVMFHQSIENDAT